MGEQWAFVLTLLVWLLFVLGAAFLVTNAYDDARCLRRELCPSPSKKPAMYCHVIEEAPDAIESGAN